MKVLVVDGQGGKIGRTVIEQLLEKGCGCDIMAVGTNTAATAAMLKAGAQEGATGENPVLVACAEADIIVGPMGIIAANSLLGEITPPMALAVSASRAQKVLIPISKCGITVAGVEELPMNDYIARAVQTVCGLCSKA